MNLKWTQPFTKLKGGYQSLSKKKKILLWAVLGALAVGSVLAAAVLNHKSYELLFGELTQKEAAEVVGKLQEMNTEYKLDAGGNIYVLKNEEARLKAQFISQGYPKSGFTYDTFLNNVDLMTTDMEKSTYLILDLQTRMEATIRLLDGVKDATVTIAIPPSSRYAYSSEPAEEPSASVVVVMKPGEDISSELARGIRRLVSGGVEGLAQENVIVLDQYGTEAGPEGGGGTSSAAKLKQELQREYNQYVESKVLRMLEPLCGAGKVRVAVNSTFELNQKLTESTQYIPSENNRGVISSEQAQGERSGADAQNKTEGGVPGSENNSDIPVYEGTITWEDGEDAYFSGQRSFEYKVSEVREQTQDDAGKLADLSIAVTLDRQDLTEEERVQLVDLVGKAAGIENSRFADKISLLAMSFGGGESPSSGAEETFPPVWIWYLIPGALLLFALAAALIFRLRRKRKEEKPISSLEEFMGKSPVPEAPVREEPERFVAQKTDEQKTRERIGDFIDKNPQIAAQVIRTWMREERERSEYGDK